MKKYSFRLVILQSWRFRGLKVTEHEVPGGDAPKVVNPHHRTALDFSGWRSITLGQIGGERSSKKIRFDIKKKTRKPGENSGGKSDFNIKGNNTISWDGILSK